MLPIVSPSQNPMQTSVHTQKMPFQRKNFNSSRCKRHRFSCYYLTVSVPTLHWNLKPEGEVFAEGVFGRWLSYQDWALMSRITVFIKETQRSPLVLRPREDMRIPPEPESEPSAHGKADALILISATLRNNACCLTPQVYVVFVTTIWMD
jgi:hypothetical protein